MGVKREFFSPLHKATQRKYIDRMVDNKVDCMKWAREYEFYYWDGDRRFGYGGYKYIPNRWTPVAEAMIQIYEIKPGHKILDVGCGK